MKVGMTVFLWACRRGGTVKLANPIPSREYILKYLEERGEPATQDILIEALNIQTADEKEGLRRRLIAMERSGQLIKTRRGGYGIADKMNLVRGTISGNKDGFGFVTCEDKSSPIFISARKMRAVFDGDKVLVRVDCLDTRGRREGTIVEILERHTQQVVGRLFMENGVGFVIPENRKLPHDILIPPGQENNAINGQIVVAEIIAQPSDRNQPLGKIIEILGEQMAPGIEDEVAIRKYNIPHAWPDALLEEIKSLKETIPTDAIEQRTDLRHLDFVTIDGEDAKDFDDAVYCESRPRGSWRLYVAIADVSHYVFPKTALDTEAETRGNSVYFPENVIPMLPEILSNGLCSLKPKVDRLCLVCEATINQQGAVTQYTFYDAVIHSKARLTYTLTADLLKGKDPELLKKHAAILPAVLNLYQLYAILKVAREKRGALEFETMETRVIFDENRRISQILPTQRNDAHRLIEECMLVANVCAANFLLKHKMPGLFRNHAGPTAEKLNALRDFLGELGLALKGGTKPEPTDYAALISQIGKRPDAHLIQTILLRSLSQAIYYPENNGHFGLAYPAYTHFTSPIRRYADLIVHRAIRHVLQDKKPKSFPYQTKELQAITENCSFTERRADEATRDALDWLKCEFMLERLGEEFEGTVSGVTGFGLFIMLDQVYVEGLVHVTSLKNDYYAFDQLRHRLRGERTNTIYRLGDRLRVKVIRVSLEDKQIDFDLIIPESEKVSVKPKAEKKPARGGKGRRKKAH
jgi:ribonuclease R